MTQKPLNEQAPHILIVDDDKRIRSLLQKFLSDKGYRATQANDAKDAREKLSKLQFDLVVLDVMMPGETGLTLTSWLRKNKNNVPILLLTALGETEQRIEGLSYGADDYLPKPFEPQELLLRIKNILRRQLFVPELDPTLSPPEKTFFGPFCFNRTQERLLKNDIPIALTTTEMILLKSLSARRGHIVSRQALLQENKGISERSIDVQINRLRRKIEDNPKIAIYLQTIRGKGYVLRVDRQE